MRPLLQAYEAKDAIIEYLRATFHFREKEVSDAFYDFIESEENGISRGPYLSLKTPFTSAESDGSDLLDITPGYSLYKHTSTSPSAISRPREGTLQSRRSSPQALARGRPSASSTHSSTTATSGARLIRRRVRASRRSSIRNKNPIVFTT